MTQNIDFSLWKELEKEMIKKKAEVKTTIQNTGTPKGEWTRKIVDKINISELASEFGVEQCPICSYGLTFDNSRGWFICNKAKYNQGCDFKGNIVNFMERFG